MYIIELKYRNSKKKCLECSEISRKKVYFPFSPKEIREQSCKEAGNF